VLGNEQLIHCQQRKRALLAESAAHRQALVAEAQNLHSVAAWVDLGIDVAVRARTGWDVLARFVPPWRRRKPEPPGFVQRFAGAVSLTRSLLSLWKSWR
jgi:hypothetical protein